MPKIIFNCSEIGYCINILGNSEAFPFDISNFSAIEKCRLKQLVIDYNINIDGIENNVFYETKPELIVFNSKTVSRIYIENDDSEWLTYSPYSLSLFNLEDESVFYAIKDLVGKRYLRNSIIRFFINHLVAEGGLFFHASGAVVANSSFIMTGFSDIGKSTVLELLNAKNILSDDIIGSRFLDGKHYFYSTPFGRQVGKNVRGEAKAVFFLVQAKDFRVERLIKTQAVARYIAVHQKYVMSLFKPLRIQLFKQAKEFFKDIPAYELHFAKDYIDKAEIIRIMNGDESRVGDSPMSELDWQIATMTKIKKTEE